ncbi:MAG TPA: hypothetical protein VFT95_14190 [Micromonosporaceae bacterium]|nr:hypothetical protein [Micromonosporaceae bacterium]
MSLDHPGRARRDVVGSAPVPASTTRPAVERGSLPAGRYGQDPAVTAPANERPVRPSGPTAVPTGPLPGPRTS